MRQTILIAAILLWLLTVSATPAHTQTTTNFIVPTQGGKTLFVHAVSFKDMEVWTYNGALRSTWELIGHKRVLPNGPVSGFYGSYTRWNTSGDLQRFGVTGFVRYKFGNWTVKTPWYLYQGVKQKELAVWAPNFRVSTPVTRDTSLGLGLAFTAQSKGRSSLVAGPHLENIRGNTTLNMRLGQHIHPTPRWGDLQLFMGMVQKL